MTLLFYIDLACCLLLNDVLITSFISGKEYVYKEPKVTSLAEVSERDKVAYRSLATALRVAGKLK